SIPDYLALVGDDQDGIPGVPKWGAKSSATMLFHYEHLEAIPADEAEWAVKVRGAAGLAANLRANQEEVALYKRLATVRLDVPIQESLDDLQWRGPTEDLQTFCRDIGYERFLDRF
ncbi:MAG: 5'-3' exonuclease H3TH domain-containing protein, partial [Planctomycetota bacterium]